jgi:Putative prokaryotic signal transducing protein
MAKYTERLMLLESTPTEMEAGVIVAALEQGGIQATMTGTYTAGFRAEAPGWVKILVAEDDLPRARTMMRDVVHENLDVDWSQVDVGEPEDE